MTNSEAIKEAIEVVNRCRFEIINLRQQISILLPKAEAYDNLVSIIQLLPKPSVVTMGEDLVWMMDKRIKELKEHDAS